MPLVPAKGGVSSIGPAVPTGASWSAVATAGNPGRIGNHWPTVGAAPYISIVCRKEVRELRARTKKKSKMAGRETHRGGFEDRFWTAEEARVFHGEFVNFDQDEAVGQAGAGKAQFRDSSVPAVWLPLCRAARHPARRGWMPRAGTGCWRRDGVGGGHRGKGAGGAGGERKAGPADPGPRAADSAIFRRRPTRSTAWFCQEDSAPSTAVEDASPLPEAEGRTSSLPIIDVGPEA